ncbi:hypothetical protein HaLaN_18054 [Haematococcus lacustris]|uniref:Uncharacterized protein n=1 Tax=Haematococcus lacustris TaxID=44745 RepID=A0A699ZIE2_HAELA|nr:hypothetical protein HaLaN_18054 [Haematococcus lacustris]
MAACTAHALALLLGLLQHANAVMVEEAVALHQCVEDRVPCGMTLRQAMDDICHQAHKHQSEAHLHHARLPLPESAYYHRAIVLLVAGLCAQAGAGAIGFDGKGDNLGIIMQPARVIRRPSRFATDSPLLIPPPLNTPCLPFSLSQGSAAASPSTPPIQGPEAASKAAACSASPNHRMRQQQLPPSSCATVSPAWDSIPLLPRAAGYWTADVKIVFAVCDSAASNVGKHSGVVMRLAAAKIKAGHQVHTIWVVHCWEHVLHNSVRHLHRKPPPWRSAGAWPGLCLGRRLDLRPSAAYLGAQAGAPEHRRDHQHKTAAQQAVHKQQVARTPWLGQQPMHSCRGGPSLPQQPCTALQQVA